ncbi:hypothetical protein DICPUDRAFT_84585, partial [Dictyostelium purpureum]
MNIPITETLKNEENNIINNNNNTNPNKSLDKSTNASIDSINNSNNSNNNKNNNSNKSNADSYDDGETVVVTINNQPNQSFIDSFIEKANISEIPAISSQNNSTINKDDSTINNISLNNSSMINTNNDTNNSKINKNNDNNKNKNLISKILSSNDGGGDEEEEGEEEEEMTGYNYQNEAINDEEESDVNDGSEEYEVEGYDDNEEEEEQYGEEEENMEYYDNSDAYIFQMNEIEQQLENVRSQYEHLETISSMISEKPSVILRNHVYATSEVDSSSQQEYDDADDDELYHYQQQQHPQNSYDQFKVQFHQKQQQQQQLYQQSTQLQQPLRFKQKLGYGNGSNRNKLHYYEIDEEEEEEDDEEEEEESQQNNPRQYHSEEFYDEEDLTDRINWLPHASGINSTINNSSNSNSNINNTNSSSSPLRPFSSIRKKMIDKSKNSPFALVGYDLTDEDEDQSFATWEQNLPNKTQQVDKNTPSKIVSPSPSPSSQQQSIQTPQQLKAPQSITPSKENLENYKRNSIGGYITNLITPNKNIHNNGGFNNDSTLSVSREIEQSIESSILNNPGYDQIPFPHNHNNHDQHIAPHHYIHHNHPHNHPQMQPQYSINNHLQYTPLKSPYQDVQQYGSFFATSSPSPSINKHQESPDVNSNALHALEGKRLLAQVNKFLDGCSIQDITFMNLIFKQLASIKSSVTWEKTLYSIHDLLQSERVVQLLQLQKKLVEQQHELQQRHQHQQTYQQPTQPQHYQYGQQ